MSADLIEQLRAMSRHEHSDLSLGAEAVGEIERLQAAWDTAYQQAMENGQRALAAEAEVERLRKDAERYRWLRDVAWPRGLMEMMDIRYGNDEWDEKIDREIAAMEAKQ